MFATKTFDIPKRNERECPRCGIEAPLLRVARRIEFAGIPLCRDCNYSCKPRQVSDAPKIGRGGRRKSEDGPLEGDALRARRREISAAHRKYVIEHGACPESHAHSRNCYQHHGCRCEACSVVGVEVRADRLAWEKRRKAAAACR